MELALRGNGMKPQVHDTKELWAAHRARASSLGHKALILVGASRIQLGVDLKTMGSTFQLTPVQLAIDGTKPLPVLENLASDPKITGTIIVSLTAEAIKHPNTVDKAVEWIDFYIKNYKGLLSPAVEKQLKTKVKMLSNIYSSGIPNTILIGNALGLLPVPVNYLSTNTQRERDADYSLVPQPNFLLARAIRHLGRDVDLKGITTLEEATEKIRASIPSIKPEYFHESDLNFINSLTRRLQGRGAKVVFVRFPTSGLVWEIDEATSPKKYYWDQFAKFSPASTIHFKDYPDLHYNLTDGSHLDQRQKKQFTEALSKILIETIL